MSRPPLNPGPPEPVAFSTRGFHYSLQRQLETRGPCTLFLAERHRRRGPSAVREQVLVKRARDTQDASARRRLLAEASVILLLDHPAIPRVLEVAEHTAGPHLILEHVEGLPLERVLNHAARRHQPLSELFAAHVAAEVADALHHVHTRADERGAPLRLVHRGVSPRGISVTQEGAVRLGEFSAVRAVEVGWGSTDSTVLKGAVAYAAPELLRRAAIDARADLFSLGLVLVEMLSLQYLYDPPRQQPSSLLRGLVARWRGGDLAEEPTWAAPEELAARAARLRPEEVARALAHVSAPLREIAVRALRVRPEERYPTAAALRDELRACLGARPAAFGAREVVLEVRQVLEMAARARGEVETSTAPIPEVFQRQPAPRH